MIQYLRNNQIDKKRWDKVVDLSPNGRVYGYSWYLDALADYWDALVMGDYEYVMPLPYKKKYGIPCVVNPHFVQQLGIYADQEVEIEIYAEFLQALPSKFRYLQLSLSIDEAIPSREVILKKQRTNLFLDINRPYEEIAQGYGHKAKKTLRKLLNCRLVEIDDYKDVIWKYFQINRHLFPHMKPKYFIPLEVAAGIAWSKGQLITCRLLGPADEDLASHMLFLSHGRAYYVAGYQTEAGREVYGNYFFLDRFFQKYCKKIHLFDFEGSDIPGVAEFFKRWGSISEFYSLVQIVKFPMNILVR